MKRIRPIRTCVGCNQDAPHHAHGLCSRCYQRRHPRPGRTVTCGDCGEIRIHKAHGLCKRCYHRARRGVTPPREPDSAVVERILTGDWTLARVAIKAERVEVAERWAASGRSLNELARMTGWKPERYYRVGDQREKKEAA